MPPNEGKEAYFFETLNYYVFLNKSIVEIRCIKLVFIFFFNVKLIK